MFKVQFKKDNAMQARTTVGSYGNESSALRTAARIEDKYFVVRVIDPDGYVVWSS